MVKMNSKDMVTKINDIAATIKDALSSIDSASVLSNYDYTIEIYTDKIITPIPALPRLKGVIKNRIKYHKDNWIEYKNISDLNNIQLKLVRLDKDIAGWIILRHSSFMFSIVRDKTNIILTKAIWQPTILTLNSDIESANRYIMSVATVLWAFQNIDKVSFATPVDMERFRMIENNIRKLQNIKLL